MGSDKVEIEIHDEWELMIKRLENMTDELLRSTWDALNMYKAIGYYAEGITMDDWTRAVKSELGRRGLSEMHSVILK